MALSGDAAEPWRIVPNLYTAPLPGDHHLFFNPTGQAGVVVLNRPALEVLKAYEHPRPINGDSTARQLAVLQLLQPVDMPSVPARAQPHTLTAWLHITDACNLRCRYCYLKKSAESMDEVTGLAAVRALVNTATRYGFKALKLKYAGGEPTLNFKLVRRLHSVATDLTVATRLSLREVVLSNGVNLTPDMLTFIRDAGMRLMVSLDGLGDGHDAQRPLVNGRGSASLVRQSIERALATGVTPHLSITITALNVDGIPDAVDFALDYDLPFNLNFYRFNRHNASLRPNDERLITAVRTVFTQIEAHSPARSLIGALIDRVRFDHPHEHVCGVGSNYVVIDPRGRVALCQMEIERTTGDVFSDDLLSRVRDGDHGFYNLSVDARADCRACTWRYWCTGGCPLLTFRATGKWDARSPYCDVYRALFPDVLRTEGLRLLRVPH